jgi:hypothetical protein
MIVFKDQIRAYKSITPDVLNQIEYKTVWSGKRIEVGDKVLYAFVYPLNSEDYKLATFLERELDEVNQMFSFIQTIKGIIPVLKYKNDNLVRDLIIEEEDEL